MSDVLSIGVKQEQKMRKKYEDEQDEERVQRQLRQMNEEFQREMNPNKQPMPQRLDNSPAHSGFIDQQRSFSNDRGNNPSSERP